MSFSSCSFFLRATSCLGVAEKCCHAVSQGDLPLMSFLSHLSSSQFRIHTSFCKAFIQIQATRISPRGYDALCLPPVPKATRPITRCQPALTTRLVSRVYLLFSKSFLQDGQRVAKTTEPSGPLSTLSPPIASAPSELLSQVPKRPIHNPILPSLTLTQCHRKTIKNEKSPLQPLPQGSAEE